MKEKVLNFIENSNWLWVIMGVVGMGIGLLCQQSCNGQTIDTSYKSGFDDIDKSRKLLYEAAYLNMVSDSLGKQLKEMQKSFPCQALPIPDNVQPRYPLRVLTTLLPDSSAWLGIFYECDYQMYLDYGSDTNMVKHVILGVFNANRQIYAKAGIRIYISGYKIWTKRDPYESATNASQMLMLFSARMDSLNLPHDLFQLLSRHCVGCGGVAWTGNTLPYQAYYRCSLSGMLTGYYNNGIVFPLPWNLMVTPHECGHNLGCNHTHDMLYNGDNTMIDSCACAANSGYCLSGSYVGGGLPPIPSDGGSIMSYCHLGNNPGISGIKGFDPQHVAILKTNVEAGNQAGALHNPLSPGDGKMIIQDVLTTSGSATAEWLVFGATKYKYRIKTGSIWGAASAPQSWGYAFIAGLQASLYFIQVKSMVNGVWQTNWSKQYKFVTK